LFPSSQTPPPKSGATAARCKVVLLHKLGILMFNNLLNETIKIPPILK
jgi:hypothetical protein